MKKSSNWALLASMLLIVALLMTACGDTATTVPATATTAPAPADATATTAPAPAEATATTAPAPAEATATTGGGAAATATTGGSMMGDFDPSTVKTTPVEDGATLRLSGWSSSPAELAVVSQTLAMFNQVYPNVKVNYEPIPQDFDTKIRAMVQGNTEPDVFYVSPPIVDEMIKAEKLLELTPHMTELGIAKGDYYDPMINIFSREDKVYGLPKDMNSIAFFYNTEMATAGAPKADWNWDDYKAYTKAMVQGTDPNTKVFGVMHPPDHARWLPFAIANGASVLNADGTQATINSPEAVAALEWYYSLIEEGTAGVAADVGAGWPGEAFAKKRTASALEGGWLVPFVMDPASGYNVSFDAVELPTAPSGKKGNLLFTNAYGASARTQYPKASAALVMFLAGPEVQGAVLRTGFALPTLKAFENDPYFNQDDPVAKSSKVLFAAAPYGVAFYWGPSNEKINQAISQATERYFKKQQSAQEALDQAAQEIDRELR